jgi:catechol 2,3-dioxygenase-like lactoylglutathione lyase family enzyme
MFGKIHSTTIVVAEQDAAIAYYTNTLGWELTMDASVGPSMRFVTVAPPGAATHLALGTPGWFDGARQPGGWTGITVTSPDIDATYETLSARGVKFKEPVQMMPWGQEATWFYDLDGNEFFLVEDQ